MVDLVRTIFSVMASFGLFYQMIQDIDTKSMHAVFKPGLPTETSIWFTVFQNRQQLDTKQKPSTKSAQDQRPTVHQDRGTNLQSWLLEMKKYFF